MIRPGGKAGYNVQGIAIPSGYFYFAIPYCADNSYYIALQIVILNLNWFFKSVEGSTKTF